MSNEDVLLWPDGMWCYRQDLSYFHWKGDDYEVIHSHEDRWLNFVMEFYK